MSQNNKNADKIESCLYSIKEYEAYKKRQDKSNLIISNPDFSKLFGKGLDGI